MKKYCITFYTVWRFWMEPNKCVFSGFLNLTEVLFLCQFCLAIMSYCNLMVHLRIDGFLRRPSSGYNFWSTSILLAYLCTHQAKTYKKSEFVWYCPYLVLILCGFRLLNSIKSSGLQLSTLKLKGHCVRERNF